MNLRVKLKLKLFNEKKVLKVKYNTFEKATFDEYLVCSAMLNSKNEEECFTYIDDITGDGSLNSHFKKLYKKFTKFSNEQLERIMENSMIPTLKIDEKNSYDYFPQINVSVFRNKVYPGDLQDDLQDVMKIREMLRIEEEIVEWSVYKKREDIKSDPYIVSFSDDKKLQFRFYDRDIDLNENLFTQIAEIKINGIEMYKGTIHDKCDGDGWSMVTNSSLNNLQNNINVYYEDGDHFAIKNEFVKRTSIAKIYGLYIYKEINIPYKSNSALCEKVAEIILKNGNIASWKSNFIQLLLTNITNLKTQQSLINAILFNRAEKDFAIRGLNLILNGLIDGWIKTSYDAFLKYADVTMLNVLYKANSNLNYSIEQLIKIDKNRLTEQHFKQVSDYSDNLHMLKATIVKLVGEVTTSGLRERAKLLKADDDTKKFSKLCNKLIGHEINELDNASLKVVEQWHKDALELKEISIIIEEKLKSQN